MTAPTPTRLFWRVMRGEYVHSAWDTEAAAQRMAAALNWSYRDGNPFTVEAWS